LNPRTRRVKLSKIWGGAVDSSSQFTFERTFTTPETIENGDHFIWWLEPKDKLPARVDTWTPTIQWWATIDGSEVSLGRSGPHTIYATLARPHGKMQVPMMVFPTPTGPEQDVTEERIKVAIDYAQRCTSEKDVVEAVFNRMSAIQHYVLNRYWPLASPGATMHQYLWQLIAGSSRGQCEQLAAAFVLACQMLGVGPIEIGRMFPAGRRDPVTGQPRAIAKRGYYEKQETRTHSLKHRFSTDESHGREVLGFIDHSSGENLFEGVAKYGDRYLYGIGERGTDRIPSSGSTADENAHLWFERKNFVLHFVRDEGGECEEAYQGEVDKARFYWGD
jgi:hypothetical protein